MNPDLPLVLSLRGSVFTEMRNYEMALRDYIRYLKRVPGDIFPHTYYKKYLYVPI